MIRVFSSLLLITVLAISCQKDKGSSTVTSAATVPSIRSTPPTAFFEITNQLSPTSVWEGLELKLNNQSKNAVSYLWDFGNGVTATDKNPTGIAMGPCTFKYTISLTVQSADGQASTYAVPYYVVCSRGMSFAVHK